MCHRESGADLSSRRYGPTVGGHYQIPGHKRESGGVVEFHGLSLWAFNPNTSHGVGGFAAGDGVPKTGLKSDSEHRPLIYRVASPPKKLTTVFSSRNSPRVEKHFGSTT